MRVLLVILVALGLTARALAEEAAVSRQEMEEMKARLERMDSALKKQEAIIEKQQKTIDEQTRQLKEWKEAAVSVEAEGDKWCDKIEFAFGATGVLQGSAGAKKSLTAEKDVTDGSVSFDLELTAPVTERGTAYAHLEAGNGDGIDGDIPTLSGFNDDADDDANVRLTELWYEHRFLGERLALKLGKIDLGGPCGRHESAFDANAVANDECSQFLSSGFVNSLAVEFPDDNGLGITLWASPHELLDIGIGVADADGDWENIFDNVFSMLEFDFKPKIAGRQGNYRIYGWLNDKDHVDIKDVTKTREEGYGFGLSLDQELTDIVTAFARYGWQRGSVYQVEHAWSTGLLFSGKFYGREDDAFGLAYGMAIIGSDWKDIEKANGVNSGNEHHVELYYNFTLNKHISISPDIQWVRNPNGDDDNDDVWAFGLRVQIQF